MHLLLIEDDRDAAGRHPAFPGTLDLAQLWQLLAGARVLEGRTCAAYPACQAEVELAGGTYANIPVDQAVTDGNLVTAPAWPAHPTWIAQFLVVLGTQIVH